MKENGIEKLCELLNEYAKVLGIGNHIGWHNRKTVENSDFIFTKKFGFIKWLVENDKIDFSKVKRVYKNKRVCNITNATIDYIAYGKYESLLMLLSIQDNPIELLISILK